MKEEVGEGIKGLSNRLVFPMMAFIAGLLGGVFGIGGGMLISPLLIQVGIAPEVKIYSTLPFLLAILDFTEFGKLCNYNFFFSADHISNLFIHGIFLLHYVSSGIPSARNGASKQCPCLIQHLPSCIAYWAGSSSESNRKTWKSITDCVLCWNSDGFEYCSDN